MRNLLFGLILLSGCATQPQYLNVCPTAPTYSKAFEQSVAVQLEAQPDGSPLTKMIEDYIAVRKEIALCKG
jgi:uncharacterized lipoprotein YajG